MIMKRTKWNVMEATKKNEHGREDKFYVPIYPFFYTETRGGSIRKAANIVPIKREYHGLVLFDLKTKSPSQNHMKIKDFGFKI